jgi:hypothetical protein
MLQAMPILEHLQPAPESTLAPQSPTGVPSIPLNPTAKPEPLPDQRVGVPSRVGGQTDSTTIITNGGPNSSTGVVPAPAIVDSASTLTEQRPNASVVPDATGAAPDTNTQAPVITPPNLPLTTGRETDKTQPELNTTTPPPNSANNPNIATPIPNAATANPNAATPIPNSQTPGPGASGQLGNPMLIPDSALNSGSTRFLEGSWSAGAGIQDAATGKPVRLEYDFSQGNGQGRVTVKRGDGVQCTGSVGAQMQGRSVQINDRGTAKCTDGSTMALPKVTCTPGAGNQAACQGQYDNGTSFPVSMRHAPK